MRRRTITKALLALLVGVVAVLAPAATPGGAQVATPTVTVTPATDLVDGQEVEVDGSGFPAGTLIGLVWCQVGASVEDCGFGLGGSEAAPDGTFSDTIRAYGCGDPSCELVAVAFVDGDFGPEARYVVSFDVVAVPTAITVTPSADLVDRQVVSVTGSRFPAWGLVGVAICPQGQAVDVCGFTGLTATTTDANGWFSLDFQVLRHVGSVDCAAAPCEVVALALGGPEARHPVSFVGDVVPPPVVTVAIDPHGTADDAGLATVSAVISCDRATDVVAVAEVGQDIAGEPPGIHGTFSFTDHCTPDRPVLGFFPTRHRGEDDDGWLPGPFVPGPAGVSVSAGPPGGPQVTEHADVALIDHEPLVEVILLALQDPAEVELRAALLRAIQARVRQDPVFAAEWFAALAG